MIDVKAAKGAYNDGIIDDIVTMRRKYDVTDAMTKAAHLLEFNKYIEKNKLHYEIVNQSSKSQMSLSLHGK